MDTSYRSKVTAYIASQRHLKDNGRGAKTLRQMAKELGTTPSTVRRWVRRDHWDTWMDYWPSADEIWIELGKERDRLSAEQPPAE